MVIPDEVKRLEVRVGSDLLKLKREILATPTRVGIEWVTVAHDIERGFLYARPTNEKLYVKHLAEGLRLYSRHLYRIGTFLHKDSTTAKGYYLAAEKIYLEAARELEAM